MRQRRKQMAKDVTLADIAEKVGVSTVAVSKALSGKAGVSDELRMRIKSIADEMGYIPATYRKAAVETGNIGVIVPEQYYGYSISFYGKLYEKVVRALYDNQYYGILEILGKDAEKERELPRVMQEGKVDGLIFLGQMAESYIRAMVEQTNLPVFFLDTYMPSVVLDTVISDGYYGMYMLTNYLIKRGHKRIAYVGSVGATSSIADRFWGYRRALRESGIPFQEEWEIPDRDERDRTFDKVITEHKGVDAYVCNCDYTAFTVINDLEELGLGVPEDVSVVGFDNFLPEHMDSGRITSYEVDVEHMADLCVKSIIRKIKNRKYTKGVQIVTGEIVEKQSVADRG